MNRAMQSPRPRWSSTPDTPPDWPRCRVRNASPASWIATEAPGSVAADSPRTIKAASAPEQRPRTVRVRTLPQEADEQVDRGRPDRMEEVTSEGAAFNGVTRPSRRGPAVIAVAAVAVLAVALLTRQASPVPTAPRPVGTPQRS